MSAQAFWALVAGMFALAVLAGLWAADAGGIRRTARDMGGCVGAILVVLVGLGLCAALLFGVVRIVRLAWGSP